MRCCPLLPYGDPGPRCEQLLSLPSSFLPGKYWVPRKTGKRPASGIRLSFALTAKGLVSGFFYRFSAKKRTACAYPAPCPMRWLILHLKEQPSSALLEDLTWKTWICGDQAIADVTAPSLVSPTSFDGVQAAGKCPIVGNTEAPCCALDS
jgi:hypothetical protein